MGKGNNNTTAKTSAIILLQFLHTFNRGTGMGASDSEEDNEDNVEHSSLTKVFSLSLCRVFKLKLLWGLSSFLLSYYLREDW